LLAYFFICIKKFLPSLGLSSRDANRHHPLHLVLALTEAGVQLHPGLPSRFGGSAGGMRDQRTVSYMHP